MAFSLERVWAIMLRYFFSERRNILRITDAFYWPALDISLWGLTSVWMQQQQIQLHNIVLVILTGLVLWQAVMRANYEITVNLMEEMWDRSLISLFSTPLTISEWIVAVMINGFVKTMFVLSFGIILVYLLYGQSIISIGLILVPFALSLIMFGWTVGFLGGSAIIYYGKKAQNLPWVMAFLFAPVSGVYYPIDILPAWLQKIAYGLPAAHIFEGVRAVMIFNYSPMHNLYKGFVLNIVYLAASLALFVWMFRHSTSHGLDRL